MARLLSELQRLYFPRALESAATGVDDAVRATEVRIATLLGSDGMVRAMILEIGAPAHWESISAVWRGVQHELELPAPAIAVSGLDGYQLWFSLAEAVPVSEGHAFLQALRKRFVPEIAPRRIRMLPAGDLPSRQSLLQEAMVPAQLQTGNWSAFVAPDLAPIFVDTPWLDIAPTDEGQAELLRGIRSINRVEWESAQAQLGLLPPAVARGNPEPQDAALDPKNTNADATSACQDARQFLLTVMNDETVALALRIESAKALLRHSDARDADQGG